MLLLRGVGLLLCGGVGCVDLTVTVCCGIVTSQGLRMLQVLYMLLQGAVHGQCCEVGLPARRHF
jgi:hypothetical protein